jgi:Spy/CpxP family protein refolding chaperone
MFSRIAITALLVTASSVALAHPHGGAAPRSMRQRPAARLFQGLDLSDAQKEKIREIHDGRRQSIAPLREELRSIRRDYRGIEDKNSPQAEKLEARMDGVHDDMQSVNLRTRRAVEEILTPEQRAKLETKLKMRNQR